MIACVLSRQVTISLAVQNFAVKNSVQVLWQCQGLFGLSQLQCYIVHAGK